MSEQIVTVILMVIAAFLSAGILFSVFFLARGLKVVDEGAHGSSIGFRIIIIPGIIVFWPMLLRKWIRAERALRVKGSLVND